LLRKNGISTNPSCDVGKDDDTTWNLNCQLCFPTSKVSHVEPILRTY